jgi:hypothetical protein
MNHHEVILETLRRLRRRVLLNRLAKDLVGGLGLILLAWIGIQISGGGPAFRGVVVGLLAVALVGAIVWELIRRESLGRTAGLADSRGGLKDEMKTAYSFIHEERSSPWIQLQISRAVDTLRDLDAKTIAPITVSGRLLFADGVLLVVGALLWATPGLLRDPAGNYTSVSEVDEEVRKIGELLQSPGTPGEPEEEAPAEAVEKLDDTIRQLERGELSLDEGLQRIQETEDRLTEAALDVASMKEDLESLAESLDDQGALAEALKQQELQEAAELLRALAEKALAGESLEGLQDLVEQLENAETRSAQLEEWVEALKQAAEALESGDPNAAEQLMGDAADQLESIDAEMKLKSQMNQAGLELDQLRNALAQDARFQKTQVQEEGEVQMRALDPLDPETQALAEALASLDIPESEDPMGGNPDGIPMGPVVDKAAAEIETLPLDVQLEREMLEPTEEPEQPVPEEISQEASREARSELDYENVRARSDYVESDVMSAERIPWPYRDIVKRYFQTLQRKTEQ